MTLSELFQQREEIRVQLPDKIRETEVELTQAQADYRNSLQALRAAKKQAAQAEQFLEECQQACQQIPQAQTDVRSAAQAVAQLKTELKALERLLAALMATRRPQPRKNIKPRPLSSAFLAWLQAQKGTRGPDAKTLRAVTAAAQKPGAAFSASQNQKVIAILKKQIRLKQQALAKAMVRERACKTKLNQLRRSCARMDAAEEKAAAMRAEVRRCEEAVKAKADTVTALQARLKSLREELARLQAAYDLALERLIPDLGTQIPLALLPVRLETRYVKHGQGMDLLVRIYPDDIHQDALAMDLTKTEIREGQKFWERWWRLGSQAAETDRVNVWNGLVTHFGARRGAWIAQQLRPRNPQDQPQDPVPDGQPLKPGPDFPNMKSSENAWSRSAHTRVMPDRWVALGYQKGARTKMVWGELIPETLATGPDPTAAPDLRQGVDAGMRWMVDFAEAEKKGMGLRLAFKPTEDKALERLVVLGVKATLDRESSVREWERLLNAHHYTWGLSLLPPGIPTNNTDEARSGYSPKLDAAASLPLELGDSLAAAPQCDGHLASRAWGIAEDVLAHVQYAGHHEQASASCMNRALWPATWEYYIYNMLGQDDGPFPGEADIEGFRNFYSQYVKGRGTLPAFRVGNQPYGVLPVTSLDRWVPWKMQPEVLLLSSEKNQSALRLTWDVDVSNKELVWDNPRFIPFPNLQSCLSTAVCVADLSRTGLWDLLCLSINQDPRTKSERASLGVSLNWDQHHSQTWQWLKGVPDCPEPGTNQASGLAAADLDQDGEPELIILRIQRRPNPADGAFACITVGDGLAPDSRSVNSWKHKVLLPRLGGQIVGGNVGLLPAKGAKPPGLVIMHASVDNQTNRLFITCGNRPSVEQKDLAALLPSGNLVAAGFSLYPAEEETRVLALCVVMHDGEQAAGLFLGQDLDARGKVARWLQVGTTWRPPVDILHLGIGAADLGRHARVGLLEGKAGAVNSLAALRNQWRSAVSQNRVPFIGRKGSDPDQDLVETLGMDAVSREYAVRDLFGKQFMQELARLSGNTYSSTPNEQLFNILGFQHPHLSYGTYNTQSATLAIPLVQADDVSETELLKDNYINWLATAKPEDIQARKHPKGEPNTLLFKLLRASTLWEYADAAYRLQPAGSPKSRRDPELLYKTNPSQNGPDTVTPWTCLNQVLQKGGKFSDPQLDEFLHKLNELSRLPSAALERLLTETLDLSGHRLDAWITGLATQRLWELRKEQKTGLILGGYGWVENLAPRPSGLPLSQGYIQAPSLAQATAAAVLRSGYLTHRGTASGEPLAVDLSSQRVRLALQLMEGIRRGQPLGALLGYRFERGLHENHPGLELDQYISTFRSLYPIVAGKLIPADQPVETIAANNVVDGLALLRYWQLNQALYDSSTAPGTAVPTSGPAYDAIVSELEALADITDACSDLTVAESVYQAVQGNHLRAAAGLNALSRGEVPPPEMEVLRTPRRGLAVTHRVLALWNPGDTVALKAWNGRAPRALAEPSLNQWVARHLGDPALVRCRITFLQPDTQTPIGTLEAALADLNVCPLDALYLPSVSVTAQQSDWERRITDYAMQHRPGTVPVQAGIQLVFARDPQWPTSVLSFPEFLEAARIVREFVTHTRALDARDITQAGQTKNTAWDEKELAARAAAIWKLADDWLQDAADAIAGAVDLLNRATALPAEQDPNVVLASEFSATTDDLRRVLRELAGFAVDNAVPGCWGQVENDAQALLTQLQALVKQFQPRVDSVKAAQAQETAVDFALRRFAVLLGKEFRVLPQLTQFAWADQLDQALLRRNQAQDALPTEMRAWLQNLAQVREGVGRMDMFFTCCDALSAGAAEEFQVAQLPVDDHDRWAALPNMPKENSGGRIALAMLVPEKLSLEDPLVGLVVDEWVEVIPQTQEITGLSFHYDAPGSCPPQAMLLAVSPNPRRRWNLETLEAIVCETMDAAKMRAVDLEALNADGHYLPALCLAYNQADETISTRF